MEPWSHFCVIIYEKQKRKRGCGKAEGLTGDGYATDSPCDPLQFLSQRCGNRELQVPRTRGLHVWFVGWLAWKRAHWPGTYAMSTGRTKGPEGTQDCQPGCLGLAPRLRRSCRYQPRFVFLRMFHGGTQVDTPTQSVCSQVVLAAMKLQHGVLCATQISTQGPSAPSMDKGCERDLFAQAGAVGRLVGVLAAPG